jgi:hypothetical protein
MERSYPMSSDTMIPHELRQSTHGQPMNPEPIGATLSAKAALLDAGETTYVHLEPGDGTRYELLLVPMWAPHVNAAALLYLPPACARASILVLNVLDEHDVGGAVVTRRGSYTRLRECGAFAAPWTRTLLEWWFERHLWPRIDAIRGVAADARLDKLGVDTLRVLADDSGDERDERDDAAPA